VLEEAKTSGPNTGGSEGPVKPGPAEGSPWSLGADQSAGAEGHLHIWKAFGAEKKYKLSEASSEWMRLWAKEQSFNEELFSEKGREDYSTIPDDILMGNLTLRTVNLNSLSEIVKLENLCHLDRWTVDNFVSELQRSFTLSKGLWLGKSLVGLCLSWIIPPECHLLNLMVHPSLWGRGLGRYLMEDLIETAKTEKAYKILLEVKVGNKRARKLYSNLGFIDAGFRRQYYSDGSNANLMTLELPAPPGVSLAVTKRHPPKPPVPLGRNNKP
jgi:ribosomal-protein-alanine N-acetyltransferase